MSIVLEVWCFVKVAQTFVNAMILYEVKSLLDSSWHDTSLRALATLKGIGLSTGRWAKQDDTLANSFDKAMDHWSDILDVDLILFSLRCFIIDSIKLELNGVVLQKLNVVGSIDTLVKQLS